MSEVFNLEAIIRAHVIHTLESHSWVQQDAAKALGISPRVLCYKMKQLGIPTATERKMERRSHD